MEGFGMGFVLGALVMLLVLFTLASIDSAQSDDPAEYEFVNINGLSCLEVDNQIVSCNWDNWQK